ncbi:MAG: glutathione S-transferase [Alphaproteobacteria bacterium]|nr:glutathione S-transferase [Alphaproteobacteria bacterium]
MAFILHYHPLSSFCWKALIALYEKGIDFTPEIVDFGDPKSTAAFRAIWPIAKMPVLVDSSRGDTVPEASIIVEYLDLHGGGERGLVPADPSAALEVRLQDRFYDHYIHQPMQKIVGDRLRPESRGDPHGVEEARLTIRTAYSLLDGRFAPSPWAAGEAFTLADCSAAPALFYADKVEPAGSGHASLAAYLDRLKARPSFARVLAEAEPYFGLFPA